MFISEKSMKKKFQHYWDYIIAAIITPLIWGWYYGDHFKLSLSYPLTNQSDLWMGFASIKALINGEMVTFFGNSIKSYWISIWGCKYKYGLSHT